MNEGKGWEENYGLVSSDTRSALTPTISPGRGSRSWQDYILPFPIHNS